MGTNCAICTCAPFPAQSLKALWFTLDLMLHVGNTTNGKNWETGKDRKIEQNIGIITNGTRHTRSIHGIEIGEHCTQPEAR